MRAYEIFPKINAFKQYYVHKPCFEVSAILWDHNFGDIRLYATDWPAISISRSMCNSTVIVLLNSLGGSTVQWGMKRYAAPDWLL